MPARVVPDAVSAAAVLVAPVVLRAWMLSVGTHGSLPGEMIAVMECRWACEARADGVLAGGEAGRPSHGVAFLLRGAPPDTRLAGGQGVGQAACAYRAPEAHCLGGEYLRQRGTDRGDGEKKLGIFAAARSSRHPAGGACGELW
jgi:hypothetical protein